MTLGALCGGVYRARFARHGQAGRMMSVSLKQVTCRFFLGELASGVLTFGVALRQ